jgi:gas vesicle protein
MNKDRIAITLVICISFFSRVSAMVPQPDSLTKHFDIRSPLVKATIGNSTGMAIGGIIGGITALRIWGIDATDNPDAGLGNVFIMAAGMYYGGVFGAATGTTIALKKGLSQHERIKTFLLSLAPHLLPSRLIMSGLGINDQRRSSTLLKVTFVVSFPLSIGLPAIYYHNLMKKRKPEPLRDNQR